MDPFYSGAFKAVISLAALAIITFTGGAELPRKIKNNAVDCTSL